MKEIQLTQGKVALVDDEDFEYLNQFKWHYSIGYATRLSKIKNGYRHPIRIHREVMNPPKDMFVDHINRNTLDNRKTNLRICTISQNNRNLKGHGDSISGYKGVSFEKRTNKWRARITIKGQPEIMIGYFYCKVEAAKAYDEKAKELFGEFAKLNFEE